MIGLDPMGAGETSPPLFTLQKGVRMKVSEHVSPPEDPAEFQRILTYHAGLNLYGRPNLRIVWSGNETVTEKTPMMVHGSEKLVTTRSLKYPGISERWVLEAWYPAGHFGPPDDESGSFGFYEWTATLDLGGEFVRPTWEILVRACRLLTLARAKTYADKAIAGRNRIQRREAVQAAQDWSIVDDGYSAFGPRPWISMAEGR
jgi:hypothetical protein